MKQIFTMFGQLCIGLLLIFCGFAAFVLILIILTKIVKYFQYKHASFEQEDLSGTYTLDNSNNTFSAQISEVENDQ